MSTHAERSSKIINRYARWRAATLMTVYGLIAIHIAHWKIAGRTLAPLELHEVMYTAELGIVTAGFIFMAMAVVGTAIFGRFFCSWGCHLLALQDLCAWILAKMKIKPKPIRSRFLLLVAPAAFFYMFLWPHVVRIAEARPAPQLRIATDAEGWASFVTTDFWRNLPGPTITILTFLICGFAIVYILGTRSFCQYACPYGVIFGAMDRIAPGKIRLRKGLSRRDCLDCAICTGVCNSHIRVHEEVAEHGMVVSSTCLKDLDCVSVCPKSGLHIRFGRPSFFRSWFSRKVKRIPYDFSLVEDAFLAFTFVFSLLVFRGLYDEIPFLMSLGLAAVLSYLAVVSIRLISKRDVRLNNLQLKRSGALTLSGKLFAATAVLFVPFLAHCAFIRYHEHMGQTAFDAVKAQMDAGREPPVALAVAAMSHFRACERWGLFRSVALHQRMASLSGLTGDVDEAIRHLEVVLVRDPGNAQAALRIAPLLMSRGRVADALSRLTTTLAHPIEARLRGRVYEARAEVLARQGDTAGAISDYRAACALLPNSPSVRVTLGSLLVGEGRFREAIPHLEAAVILAPTSVRALRLLGKSLTAVGRLDEALEALQAAVALAPSEAAAYSALGEALEARGNLAAAYAAYEKAIALEPGCTEAQANLRGWLSRHGRQAEEVPKSRRD